MINQQIQSTGISKSHRMTPEIDSIIKKRTNFAALVNENKHLFDMSCDLCPRVFETFDEAQSHYSDIHDTPNGYIKCCGSKLAHQCKVEKHLKRHLEPENLM